MVCWVLGIIKTLPLKFATERCPQVFEYLIGIAFFQLYESSSTSLEDSHLRRILEHIGPFPSSFLEACQHRNHFFDAQCELPLAGLSVIQSLFLLKALSAALTISSLVLLNSAFVSMEFWVRGTSWLQLPSFEDA
jgi:hypothetical protein